MKQIIIDNIDCKIGNNKQENWKLLDESRDSNLFFHLSSFPSCYVILECDQYPNDKIINECASYCKNNTKYKNLKDVKVDYCLCSNVIKGENVGEIFYKSNRKVKQIKV